MKEGFFEKTFGPSIKAEEDRKAKAGIPCSGAGRLSTMVKLEASHVSKRILAANARALEAYWR